jgi:hypothetical protein
MPAPRLNGGSPASKNDRVSGEFHDLVIVDPSRESARKLAQGAPVRYRSANGERWQLIRAAAGIIKILIRMRSGRLKVAAHLDGFDEFRGH